MVRKHIFTNNIAHRSIDLQTLVDRFTTAAKQFSLQINNIKKAKCLYQLPKLLNDVSLPTIVFINKKLLVESKAFLYPDRTVDDYARLDKEIFLRIEHASLVKEKFIKQSLE